MSTRVVETDVRSLRADTYATLIASYTEQIEDYEKRNYGECMICITFIGMLLAAIGALLAIAASGESGVDRTALNTFIATLFSLIPAVITIFLYNFAMNCRRSTILRGYMQFLEERLNEALGETSMLYHGDLFRKEIEGFEVNRYGPGALLCALVGLYVFSFIASRYFAAYIPAGAVPAYYT